MLVHVGKKKFISIRKLYKLHSQKKMTNKHMENDQSSTQEWTVRYTLSNIPRFQKQGIYSVLEINKPLVDYVNCPTFFEANFSIVLKNLKMFTPVSPVIRFPEEIIRTVDNMYKNILYRIICWVLLWEQFSIFKQGNKNSNFYIKGKTVTMVRFAMSRKVKRSIR